MRKYFLLSLLAIFLVLLVSVSGCAASTAKVGRLHATVVRVTDEGGLRYVEARLNEGEALEGGFKLGVLAYKEKTNDIFAFSFSSWIPRAMLSNLEGLFFARAIEFKYENGVLDIRRASPIELY